MKKRQIKQILFVASAIAGFLFLAFKYVDPKDGPFEEARQEARALTTEVICRKQKSCLKKVEPHFEDCFVAHFKRTQGNAWYKTLDPYNFRKCLIKKVGKLP